jgi:hypothetical protein
MFRKNFHGSLQHIFGLHFFCGFLSGFAVQRLFQLRQALDKLFEGQFSNRNRFRTHVISVNYISIERLICSDRKLNKEKIRLSLKNYAKKKLMAYDECREAVTNAGVSSASTTVMNHAAALREQPFVRNI